MGACFNYEELRGSTKEVEEKFKELQEEDRYENGHSYSGGFGMAEGIQFLDRPAVGDIEEWLSEKAEKWGPALAVPLGEVDGETVWGIGAWCAD